jgi:hypothetical protein
MTNMIAKLIVLCMSLIIAFLACGNVWSQEVAVYYDPSKGPAWIDPAVMAPAVEAALAAENIEGAIVNADELVTYMEANQEGIVIMTTGVAPGEIFQNKGEDDLVHTWLFDGGVMFWTGDWPFYYWDAPANNVGAAGELSVFGVTVTQGADGTAMEPTDIGMELMPSIKEHLSSRPVSLAILESNDFEYESYADNGNLADPIAFQAPDMEGWFVNAHTWPEGETLEQVATEMAELVKSRFLVNRVVESIGKLATPWGSVRVAY